MTMRIDKHLRDPKVKLLDMQIPKNVKVMAQVVESYKLQQIIDAPSSIEAGE